MRDEGTTQKDENETMKIHRIVADCTFILHPSSLILSLPSSLLSPHPSSF
jgi:hypothetical protein